MAAERGPEGTLARVCKVSSQSEAQGRFEK